MNIQSPLFTEFNPNHQSRVFLGFMSDLGLDETHVQLYLDALAALGVSRILKFQSVFFVGDVIVDAIVETNHGIYTLRINPSKTDENIELSIRNTMDAKLLNTFLVLADPDKTV